MSNMRVATSGKFAVAEDYASNPAVGSALTVDANGLVTWGVGALVVAAPLPTSLAQWTGIQTIALPDVPNGKTYDYVATVYAQNNLVAIQLVYRIQAWRTGAGALVVTLTDLVPIQTDVLNWKVSAAAVANHVVLTVQNTSPYVTTVTTSVVLTQTADTPVNATANVDVTSPFFALNWSVLYDMQKPPTGLATASAQWYDIIGNLLATSNSTLAGGVNANGSPNTVWDGAVGTHGFKTTMATSTTTSRAVYAVCNPSVANTVTRNIFAINGPGIELDWFSRHSASAPAGQLAYFNNVSRDDLGPVAAAGIHCYVWIHNADPAVLKTQLWIDAVKVAEVAYAARTRGNTLTIGDADGAGASTFLGSLSSWGLIDGPTATDWANVVAACTNRSKALYGTP